MNRLLMPAFWWLVVAVVLSLGVQRVNGQTYPGTEAHGSVSSGGITLYFSGVYESATTVRVYANASSATAYDWLYGASSAADNLYSYGYNTGTTFSGGMTGSKLVTVTAGTPVYAAGQVKLHTGGTWIYSTVLVPIPLATPTAVQPADLPVKKGPTQHVVNTQPFPVQVTYKDSVTGETLGTTGVLQPGQEALVGLEKTGSNPVDVITTFPTGGTLNGADSNGNPVTYTWEPGHQFYGSPIPDADFVSKSSAPVWSPAVTAPIAAPVVAAATMTPNPGGPTSPTPVAPLVSNPVAGNPQRIQYSSAGAGTGGATDETLRESSGAIVSKLTDIEKAVKESGNGVDWTDPGDDGVGTDPGAEEVVPVKVAPVDRFIKPTDTPTYFTGVMPSTSVISATYESFGATRTWTFDAAPYAGPISWFRALLSVIVHYSMFVLVTKTGRSAAAGQ